MNCRNGIASLDVRNDGAKGFSSPNDFNNVL